MFSEAIKVFSIVILNTILAFNICAYGEADFLDIQMTPVTYDEWETRRIQYQPKIVVVDMWATWCVSCIERFPEMVRLHEQYKDHNVQFVSMNLDDREDTQSIDVAEQFLKKMNAKFDHFRMDENLLVAFEKIDLIGIPAVLIYDENGNEKYRLSGDNPSKQFTDADVEAALLELL